MKVHVLLPPLSAAGTAINCPEAVPGAEATAVCPAVSIPDIIDSTLWVLVHGCWHVCYEKDTSHCPQPLPCLLVLFRLKVKEGGRSFCIRPFRWSSSVKAVLYFLKPSVVPKPSHPTHIHYSKALPWTLKVL